MNLEKIHAKDRIFTNIVIINFSLYLIFLIFLLKNQKTASLWCILNSAAMWIAWIFYIFKATEVYLKKIILLWLMADFMALLLSANSHVDYSIRNDSEFYFAIIFSPVFLPSLIFSPLIQIVGDWTIFFGWLSKTILPYNTSTPIRNWFEFSIISLFSSIIFISIIFLSRRIISKTSK